MNFTYSFYKGTNKIFLHYNRRENKYEINFLNFLIHMIYNYWTDKDAHISIINTDHHSEKELSNVLNHILFKQESECLIYCLEFPKYYI